MSFKNNTHDVILEYFKANGLAKTISVARAMLQSESYKDNKLFHSHVHGEICESVLECIIQDYMNRYPLKTKHWFYAKGLVVKDVNNPDSGYFTEIDLALFTPQRLYAFECKSYGGDKRIVDRCTIVKKKGGKFDVYDQHEKHARVLSEQLNPFRKRETIDQQAYQLILFDFALGKTDDQRADRDKLLMPCLNETNVLNILKLNKTDDVIWDMAYLRHAISIIQKHQRENSKKHLDYVKDLNKRRGK